MKTIPKWPHDGGRSLVLVLLDAADTERRLAYSKIAKVADEYGVDILLGSQHAEELIRPGLESLPWLDPSGVMVFRCPRDFVVAEAVTLVTLGLGGLPEEVVHAGVELLTECAKLALASSERIAFVAAHDWQPGDDVRYEWGTLDEFRSYIQSPWAWVTDYLDKKVENIVIGRNYSPFWYEVRR